MAKKRQQQILFPIGGLNRKNLYRMQPPYTTYDCLNVWPQEQLQGRLRGGNRPGLQKTHPEDLGGPIRLLNSVTFTPGVSESTGSREESICFNYSNNFSNGDLDENWSFWEPAQYGSIHKIRQADNGRNYYLYGEYSDGEKNGSWFDSGDMDFSKPIEFGIRIRPHKSSAYPNGGFGGEYSLRVNCSPDGWTNRSSINVTLTALGESGDFSLSLAAGDASGDIDIFENDSFTGIFSSARRGWLVLKIDGTNVKAYWRGYLAQQGTLSTTYSWTPGYGFTIWTTNIVSNTECRFGAVKIQGYQTQYSPDDTLSLWTQDGPPGLRTMLIASADGNLFYEKMHGTMEQVTTDLTLNSNSSLDSDQFGLKFYIADYGDLRVSGDDGTVSGNDLDAASVSDWSALGIDADDDVVVISSVGESTTAGTYKISSIAAGAITLDSAPGDGTCTYRIERAPKVYDPNAGTFTIFTASTGQVPTGCPLMVRHVDRMWLAGAESAPHVWYASRKRDETDWDYSQADSEAAVAGTASEAGVPGTAITALVSYNDDYLIIGCQDALWLMRGDPGYGGSLDNLNRNIGVISKDAWCLGPNGEFIFLSAHGIYILPMITEGGQVVPFSDNVLPDEFLKINSATNCVSMEYDVAFQGIHIFITPKSSATGQHWWIDWRSKTFWPVSYSESRSPTRTYYYQSSSLFEDGVIFGGRDGYLRMLDEDATVDDDSTYSSYVMIGPFPLAPDGRFGRVLSMNAVVGIYSGDIDWEIMPASTFQGTVDASASDSGTWMAGLNAMNYPACCGQAAIIKLTGEAGEMWTIEDINMVVKEAGKRRLA